MSFFFGKRKNNDAIKLDDVKITPGANENKSVTDNSIVNIDSDKIDLDKRITEQIEKAETIATLSAVTAVAVTGSKAALDLIVKYGPIFAGGVGALAFAGNPVTAPVLVAVMTLIFVGVKIKELSKNKRELEEVMNITLHIVNKCNIILQYICFVSSSINTYNQILSLDLILQDSIFKTNSLLKGGDNLEQTIAQTKDDLTINKIRTNIIDSWIKKELTDESLKSILNEIGNINMESLTPDVLQIIKNKINELKSKTIVAEEVFNLDYVTMSYIPDKLEELSVIIRGIKEDKNRKSVVDKFSGFTRRNLFAKSNQQIILNKLTIVNSLFNILYLDFDMKLRMYQVKNPNEYEAIFQALFKMKFMEASKKTTQLIEDVKNNKINAEEAVDEIEKKFEASVGEKLTNDAEKEAKEDMDNAPSEQELANTLGMQGTVGDGPTEQKSNGGATKRYKYSKRSSRKKHSFFKLKNVFKEYPVNKFKM
jgi:hypothetical protein